MSTDFTLALSAGYITLGVGNSSTAVTLTIWA